MPSISDILIAFSVFSFTVLAGALFAPAPSAYAATAYDNVVDLTSSLNIQNTSSNESTGDYANTWYSENQEALTIRCALSGGDYCTLLDTFSQILSDPNASYTVYGNGTRIVFLWSMDEITCNFDQFSSIPYLRCSSPSAVYGNVLLSNGNCAHNYRNENCNFVSNPVIFPNNTIYNFSSVSDGSWQLYTGHSIFISTADIVYPSGYEGVIIPDTYIPPVFSDEVPQWSMLSLINFEARVIDTSFNTFDPNAWTCEEDLTPVIHYTLTGGSETQSGTFSPTVPLVLQLPEIYQQTDYVLTGYYECPDTTTFSETSTLEFQVDLNGNQSFNFFEDCFVETFPFIQFNECISNLRHVVQLMGFNLAIFGQDWVMPNTDCYALTDLHEWLGLSNNVVCKQFPSYVRTTVTPFISFAIGLMALRFLASRRRDDM